VKFPDRTCGSDGRFPGLLSSRWRENAALRKPSLRRGIALAKGQARC